MFAQVYEVNANLSGIPRAMEMRLRPTRGRLCNIIRSCKTHGRDIGIDNVSAVNKWRADVRDDEKSCKRARHDGIGALAIREKHGASRFNNDAHVVQ